MSFVFKYSAIFCFILFSLIFYYFFCFFYKLEEPFNTDWNPITDPNHVQYHMNEIYYLKDWITILNRGKKTKEAEQLKELLIPKEKHLQWHTDRQLTKPSLIKQTKFLVF